MTDANGGPARSWDEGVEYCAACGANLPANVWCPVRAETDSDGTVRIRSFCDDTCEASWADGGAGDGTEE